MTSITELFQMLRGSQKENAPIKFLLVGLGNPGPKYENTRHNVGFWALDRLAQEENCSCSRMKFHSKIGRVTIEGVGCILLKPQTFMNESGSAVEEARNYYRLSPSQVLVFSDDISLPPGMLRIRRKGSHGGHNGLRDIIEVMGSEDFPRIKLGVGKKPHPNDDLAKWVLSPFSEPEIKLVKESCQKAAAAARLLIAGKTDEAMNRYNNRKQK